MRTRGLALVLAAMLLGAAPPAPAGKPAPAFSLGLTDGRTVTLSDLRGKPVVLNFWHSG